MSEDAVTGVHSHNDVVGFFWDETTIDLQYHEWNERIEKFLITETGQELLEAHGYEEDDIPYEDDFDFWSDVERIEDETYAPPPPEANGRQLIGDWKKNEDGKFEPDEDGEFSAIYNPDHGTIQVVYSEYKIRCARTSPCYPHQGDVGTPPDIGYDTMTAYILPPELLRDEYLQKMDEYIIDED